MGVIRAEDAVRLAGHAHFAGRNGTRDTLLTLALAESGPSPGRWVGNCRDWMLRRRPDHLFAGFSTLEHALADPRVIARIDRIRWTFPAGRVRHLLLRSEALTGPYRPEASTIEDQIAAIVRDGDPAVVRPQRGRRPAVESEILFLMALMLAVSLGDHRDEGSCAA